MVKRLVDIALSGVGLVLAAPLLAAGALAIRASSPGPVLYRARRIGRNGRPFTMYKLRTMRVARQGTGSVITAQKDPRVFPIGELLRKSKLDELPQLFNVLRGDMSIIGPRPEDPKIVEQHYKPVYREMLSVRPGLASPGSLYDYTHGQRLISAANPERDYVERVLPIMTALEVIYVRRASLFYDFVLIARTLRVIASMTLGRRDFPDPPELVEARELAAAWSMSHENVAAERLVAVESPRVTAWSARPVDAAGG